MMKPLFYWHKHHKAIGLTLNPKATHPKEISIETTKPTGYWGYRYEEDFDCHSFGFYFFELCYYA